MSTILFGVCNVSPELLYSIDFCESSFEKEKKRREKINPLSNGTVSDGKGDDTHNTQPRS